MLPKLNNVERISRKVWRILGQNPGPFTLQGTNTYLIGEGKQRCLIDTGQNMEGYKELLQDLLKSTGSEINQVLITHNHIDHTLGIIDILQLNQPSCIFRKYGYDEIDAALEAQYNFKYDTNSFQENEIIKGEDFTLQVIRTPGHCSDHVCFYLLEEKTLFSGDFILSGTSNVIRNLKDQMESFKKTLLLEVDNLLSAHGTAIIGRQQSMQMIQEQMAHRQKREDAIVKVLSLKKECTAEEILEVVYPGLHESLINGALHNISVHLDKLIQDLLVIKQGEKYKWVETEKNYRSNSIKNNPLL